MTRQALSRIGQPSRPHRFLTDLGVGVASVLIILAIILAVYVLGSQVTQ